MPTDAMAITNNGGGSSDSATEESMGASSHVVKAAEVSSSEAEPGQTSPLEATPNMNQEGAGGNETVAIDDTTEMDAGSIKVSPSSDEPTDTEDCKLAAKDETSVAEVALFGTTPAEASSAPMSLIACTGDSTHEELKLQIASVASSKSDSQSVSVEISPSVDEPSENDKQEIGVPAAHNTRLTRSEPAGSIDATIGRGNGGELWGKGHADKEIPPVVESSATEDSNVGRETANPAPPTAPLATAELTISPEGPLAEISAGAVAVPVVGPSPTEAEHKADHPTTETAVVPSLSIEGAQPSGKTSSSALPAVDQAKADRQPPTQAPEVETKLSSAENQTLVRSINAPLETKDGQSAINAPSTGQFTSSAEIHAVVVKGGVGQQTETQTKGEEESEPRLVSSAPPAGTPLDEASDPQGGQTSESLAMITHPAALHESSVVRRCQPTVKPETVLGTLPPAASDACQPCTKPETVVETLPSTTASADVGSKGPDPTPQAEAATTLGQVPAPVGPCPSVPTSTTKTDGEVIVTTTSLQPVTPQNEHADSKLTAGLDTANASSESTSFDVGAGSQSLPQESAIVTTNKPIAPAAAADKPSQIPATGSEAQAQTMTTAPAAAEAAGEPEAKAPVTSSASTTLAVDAATGSQIPAAESEASTASSATVAVAASQIPAAPLGGAAVPSAAVDNVSGNVVVPANDAASLKPPSRKEAPPLLPLDTETTSFPIDLNSLQGLSAARKNGKRKRDEKAPFHFLMLPASEQPPASAFKGADSMLLVDPQLRRDYLSRRFRAYNPQSQMKDTATATTGPSSPIGYCTDITLWSGASSLERSLIECCELPPLPKHQKGAASGVSGGSLARGLEVRFAGLVTDHCHDFKSRLLALAILERSLEQDHREATEDENEDEDDEETSKKKTASGGLGEGEDDDEDSESEDDSDDDDYDEVVDWDPKESRRMMTRGSRRLQARRRRSGSPKKKSKRGRKGKQAKAELEETNDDKSENDQEGQTVEPEIDRMLVFFSAGGLKILKNWLLDAMTPIVVVPPKPSLGTKELRSTSKLPKHKASEYGQMLIPLLTLLSKIPFNKDLVVESKINKQIRRLSKQVDGLIKDFKRKNGGKSKDDEEAQLPGLDTFVDPEGGVGGCAVIKVQEILNRLKKTWEEQAMKSPANEKGGQPSAAVKDPFESIKGKLRDRLKELNKHKSSEKVGEGPEWLKKIEELDEERERKRPRYLVVAKAEPVTKSEESSKESTEQLALKEREAERAALKDKLKAAQEERKAHLARLKSQISKRMHGNSVSAATRQETRERKKRKRNGKSVKWKDGLTSDKTKKRELLEEVFILKDAAKETAKPPPAEAMSEEPAPAAEPEPEPSKEEEVSSRDLDLDPEGLFDFDETLLL